MKENEKSEALTKILEDQTPDEDAFGGHQKVAKAIYELIEDEKEGGKAIALSGSYGSGKSTVINFLKRKFQENKKKDKTDTQIFVFDAWEHQGNPLRRAFLEKYINFLRADEVKWAGKKEWKEELEIISKNREEIETTTEPTITTLGGWFALTILLLPLGLASVRLGLVPHQAAWLLNIGFGLLLLPSILLLGIYLSWRPFLPKHWAIIKEVFDLEDFKYKRFYKYVWYFLYHHRPNHHKKSIFNFVIKKSTEEIETKSLKSPDPTTIEFQKLFGKITNRVLREKNRRLIIVVDNIDRLTTESSINAWTTLQTFFKNDDKKLEWNKQFWMIAPFDLQELKNLWSGLDHLTNSGSSGTSDKTSDYVQAFIDKTFQILFRVPQPALSDWKVFFEEQLGIAFPAVKKKNPDIFNNIAILYQLKGIKDGNSPTPREIKQFINRLGAQYRIWHGEINLPALAYYELVAVIEHQEIVQKLQKGELVDPTFKSVIGEDKLNKKLAAIHFNCKIEKANQVLFGAEVATALQEGKSESLGNYFTTEGFKDILDSEFYTLKGSGTAQTLANCALCLNEIEENSKHEFNNYWHQLLSSFQGVTSFKPFNKSIGKGIVTVWQKTGFSEQWITSVLTNLSEVELDEEDNSIEEWFLLIQPILVMLSEKGLAHLLKEELRIPGDSTDYIRVLNRLNKLDEERKTVLARYLQPNSNTDKIVNTYSNFISSDDMPDDLGGSLYLLSLSKKETEESEWNWEALISQIKDIIKVNSNSRADQIEAALKMMLVLSFKLSNNDALKLSSDQNFKDGLFYLIKSQGENLSGLLILNSILFNPNNQTESNDNNVNRGLNSLNNILSDPSGKKFIHNDFLNYLIEFQLIEEFLSVQYGIRRLDSLSKLIIKKLFESEKARELLKSDTVFMYFNDFNKALDEDSLSDHIEVLYNHEEKLVDRITTDFETIPSSYREHYYFAKSCPDELREQYFEYLAEGFRNLEKDDWLKHLKDETELIHLAILIQENGFELELSIQLKDALFDHFKQVYNDQLELTNQQLLSKWNILLSSLKNDIKDTLLLSMKDHIESDTSTESSVSSVGEIYDSIFLECEIFLDSPERLVRTVFSRVLNSKNVDELIWLKNLINKEPKILNKAGSATVSFKEEIKVIDTSDSPEAGDVIDEIAIILQIDRNDDNIED